MPIIECDAWREQYFARVPCPPDVVVPTDDPESWRVFPAQRWVFNKLLICATQGIEHGPHGVEPPFFPIFSKPIYNMRGMGAGSRVVHTAEELHATLAPGHMWMRLLDGEHVSTDLAVVGGTTQWCRHSLGAVLGDGLFDYWTVLAEGRPALEDFLADWIAKHLASYTGMINIETIGGRIIECHLRFADQWPDLYGGDAWVKAVVDLHAGAGWSYDDSKRRTGYSVVLWGPHGRPYRHPPLDKVDAVRESAHVSSVQITFDPDKPPEDHSMPPGGFRLAIVNCWDLDAGRAARERLRALFV